MKHLKLYENINPTYWMLNYYNKDSDENSYSLYPDKDSVENAILEIVNDERKEYLDAEEQEYDDDMIFIYMEDALKWYQNNFSDIEISYENVTLSNKMETNEKIKKLRTLKNYNL